MYLPRETNAADLEDTCIMPAGQIHQQTKEEVVYRSGPIDEKRRSFPVAHLPVEEYYLFDT